VCTVSGADLTGTVQEAGRLARDCFADNLLVSFIGGSHASGHPKTDSDIDTFVVLHAADLDTEREYARRLRALHDAAGLRFEHCGEVFDRTTVEDLLAFTDAVLTAVPQIQDLACYQADCLLSVFRKGDVVFKFLTDPRIHVDGDRAYLGDLQRRAEDNFRRYPRPRVQFAKGRLELRDAGAESYMRDLLARCDWIDTPTGVGLGRWFAGHSLPGREPASASTDLAELDRTRCPLYVRPRSQSVELIARQCLAHTRSQI
jgi:hypothetical protein